ncbi:MAG: alanyl-tRNA editing protein [Calditrichaeota bacterium]|nr:MAG: alanyl-tRNA editing protein [Calditrichota bacterium]
MNPITPRLFLSNSYWTDFRGEVLQTFQKENHYGYLLDQTFFHPQTDEQPCDKGTLNGIPLTEVMEIDGSILHVTDQQIELEDEIVEAEIDWDFRFLMMRQHSAAHLISYFLPAKFKKNVSHKILPEWFSIFTKEPISREKIESILVKANSIVNEGKKIEVYFGTKCSIDGPKVKGIDTSCETGPNRVVEIEGLGREACYGTHCKNTSEIGEILFESSFQMTDGNFRMNFYLGE